MSTGYKLIFSATPAKHSPACVQNFKHTAYINILKREEAYGLAALDWLCLRQISVALNVKSRSSKVVRATTPHPRLLQKETMKIRLLLALVGLAISYALPTFAGQSNTPDPQLREQVLALVLKFDPAFNNNDAAAQAPFYTEDAVLVVPEGPVYGREAIVKFWVGLFQKVRFSNHLGTLDQYSPHMIGTSGNEVWATGGWSQTIVGPNLGVKGYWSGVVVRAGNDWKFRLHAITPPPYEPAQTK